MPSDIVKSERIECERCGEPRRLLGRVEVLEGGRVRVFTYARRHSRSGPFSDPDYRWLFGRLHHWTPRVERIDGLARIRLDAPVEDPRRYADPNRTDLDLDRCPRLVLPGDRVELRCPRKHVVVVDDDFVRRALLRMGVAAA